MRTLKHILPSAALASAIVVAGGLDRAKAQEAEAASQTEEVTDEIVVRGVFVPDEKRSTSEISSVLDAEAFSRAGDSDVAAALARVTGVTIADGKFPIVRGLNERYSSATLNGVPLPSPEPLRRAAPLDLFPTSILEGTLVQKTFSPQYSGEFGGGLVELRSRPVPDEDFATVSLGFSLDTETTLRNGLFYEGSDTDVLGFDDGLRDLPAGVDETVRSGATRLPAEIGTGFEQDDTLLLYSGEAPANGGGSLALGKVFVDDGDLRIGTTFYGSYDNDWQTRAGVRQRPERFDGSTFVLGPQAEVNFDFDETRNNVIVSLYNTTGVEFGAGDHTVSLTSFLLRDTLKRAQISTGSNFDVEGGDQQILERTEFIERQVWQSQLGGEHLLPSLMDAEVSWRVAYGEGQRDSPYERQTTYVQDGDDGPFEFFTGTAAATTINFSELMDENFFAGGDVTLPFDAGIPIEFTFGAAYSDKSRDNIRRDFAVQGRVPDELARSRADLVLSDTVIGAGILEYQVQASNLFPDLSSASLEVLGVYGMADIELNEYLRASVGVRYEDSAQESDVSVSFPSTIDGPPVTLDDEFFLPAATVTWNPVGNLQLRAGYSKTVTRPQFRELAATAFIDPDTDIEFFGNPFLINSELDNFDVRAEYYFGGGDFVTLGAFYKDIQNPIEQFAQGTDATTASFLNAPSAELYGIEAEFEKRFEMTDALNLFVNTNYTWSDSEVSADGQVVIPTVTVDPRARTLDAAERITDGRRLQGQSEHLFNLQLGVEHPESDAKATLLLNYASDRILLVENATAGGFRPPIIEEPPVALDFVISQTVPLGGADYGLGIKIENLLASRYNATQTDDQGVERVFQDYDRGRIFSVSVSREF